MSESTESSPSVHLHPMSPSSSFSSTDSAPRSEPTSDEQPDLGAFNTVLREWTHLQPIQRIPVQIHSATSSTTPTYQPEQSVAGSDYLARNFNSRRSRMSSRSGVSELSSFTRPPSSSVQPEGSTVWNQALIASYLHSTTPSNDILSEADEEEEEQDIYGEQEYTPSPPNSLASTALTVEIASEIDFPSSDGFQDSHANLLDATSSPHNLDPGIERAIVVGSDGQRLDSRETAHPEDETNEGVTASNNGDNSSHTSRDYIRPSFRDRPYLPSSSSHSQVGSQQTSVQLQSQAQAHTTTAASSSDSLALFHATSVSPNANPSASPSPASQSYSSHSNNNATSNSSTSTSTLISALLNRSRNPLPPRTTSDSSINTNGSASSSNFSLLSYQIPETPPIEEESDSEPKLNEEHALQTHHHSVNDPSSSSQSLPSTSSSVSLKSQRSMHSSNYSISIDSTISTQRQALRPSLSSSMSHISPGTRSDISLPNPHSPLPSRRRDIFSGPTQSVQLPSNLWAYVPSGEFGVVDDLGTPDQAPSETLLFDPVQQRPMEFLPIDDVDKEEDVLDEQALVTPHAHTVGHTHSQISPSKRAAPLMSNRVQAHDQLGSSSSRIQASDLSERPHLKLQHEDQDEANDDYPYRYPFAHTPKSNAQALTPKGIPLNETQASLQKVAPSQIAVNQSQAQQYPPQSDLLSSSQLVSSTTHAHTQTFQQPYAQQSELIQQQSQHLRPSIASQSQSRSLPQLKPWSGLTQTIPPSSQMPSTHSYVHASSSSSHRHSDPPATDPSSMDAQVTQPQRYPHSLLGLHALPTSLVSPEAQDLPGYDFHSTTLPSRVSKGEHRPLVEMDSAEVLLVDTDEGTENEQPLPSLGYLDEALSFIAAERARWSAAREGPGSSSIVAVVADTDATDSREVGGGGANVPGSGEEMAGKQALDNEQDLPKRKRRRKRPPRAHATPQVIGDDSVTLPVSSVSKGEGVIEDSSRTLLTPASSPKKKKRSKSASARISAAGSTTGSVMDSPSKTKGKGKIVEKEFLVPPSPKKPRTVKKKDDQPVVTILRRPTTANVGGSNSIASDEDEEEDSDGGDGGRTPTNEVRKPDKLEPINLVGKKGKRVGRKEREREKLKRDLQLRHQEGSGAAEDVSENPSLVVDSDDADDDDNDEEGDCAEPQDDDDDDDQTNDSLSNMSLLKPPRRNRSRSRRRRGRDTAYIHSLVATGGTGAYKSTPATPKTFKFEGIEVGEDEDVSLDATSVQIDNRREEDIFASKQPNNALVGEKKKRTRTKRVKTLAHAKSDPDLRLDTVVGGAATHTGEDSEDTASKKLKKGNAKSSAEDTMDILEMDRNQLQKLIFASSGAGSRLLLANQHRNDSVQSPPDSKRGRLLTLANKLVQLFPEQREDLGRVIARIERQGAEAAAKTKRATMNPGVDPYDGYGYNNAGPVPVTGLKRKKSRKAGYTKAGVESAGHEGFDFDDYSMDNQRHAGSSTLHFTGTDDEEKEEEEIDPRGRPPKKGDVLIHVFIDHSNILIGLLSHLKRHPPQRRILSSPTRGRLASAVLTKSTTTAPSSNEKLDPASAFAAVKSTSTRPLPMPTSSEAPVISLKRQLPIPVPKAGNPPIPLPSFATMSRSLPVGSVMSASRKDLGQDDSVTQSHEINSDGNDNEDAAFEAEAADAVGTDTLFVGTLKKEKKIPKHMWHSALTLILERGRPITRRVVVTSSPLYQPMESIERLGYELRVFIRVPDFGDGMDRERHRDKDRNMAGKSTLSSPSVTSGSSLATKKGRVGHVRHISGSTSTESGSGGAGSGPASGGGVPRTQLGIASDTSAHVKVKYREQGVDELLQLKLHQALADADDVPEGSTIVLATGDGNMGQFNEDGFLGPVRTALRRGWRVELYAWEDGLSRAWRREFGAGSEWGRKGMFKVIGMEQFASGLVEASGWS